MAARNPAPTLDDVARVAGVSRATVSRAVRGGHRVSPQAQQAIEAAIQQLDYVPNQAARSLALRRSNTIAVIVSEPHRRVFHDPFFSISVAAVAERLEDTDQHMALYLSYGSFRRKLEEYLVGGHVDAVLVVSHHDEDRLPTLLERVGRPCMFLGRPAAEPRTDGGFSVAERFVDVDNVAGGRAAGEHLVAQGCRRIATISGHMDIASARERHRGFHEALADAGLEPVAVRHGNYEPESGRTNALELLRSGVEFDGLFVASDHMAAAALSVLNEHDVQVPRDVKLVGFDDAEISRVTSPALTTVTNPWRDLATAATERILAEIDGAPPAGPLILQPELIVRGSTRPA
ncbi:LacI family transcriptional regulator [Arachnia propionica]|uniref:LacI family transcriptional regulator n=1 Tax=Arachnia propionica TaxID=1750 RepID=A0A3P1T3T8_9ACTN|nr:LacI family DNA-binding transcriptional regulator [Arachnia propionica]MDO5083174.1 LacI family DNA-binding transcriptional regulator [Arachnia propionica]RRD03948.1 LacI family transcriptional regulator [Arachnia propionica]